MVIPSNLKFILVRHCPRQHPRLMESSKLLLDPPGSFLQLHLWEFQPRIILSTLLFILLAKEESLWSGKAMLHCQGSQCRRRDLSRWRDTFYQEFGQHDLRGSGCPWSSQPWGGLGRALLLRSRSVLFSPTVVSHCGLHTLCWLCRFWFSPVIAYICYAETTDSCPFFRIWHIQGVKILCKNCWEIIP